MAMSGCFPGAEVVDEGGGDLGSFFISVGCGCEE